MSANAIPDDGEWNCLRLDEEAEPRGSGHTSPYSIGWPGLIRGFGRPLAGADDATSVPGHPWREVRPLPVSFQRVRRQRGAAPFHSSRRARKSSSPEWRKVFRERTRGCQSWPLWRAWEVPRARRISLCRPAGGMIRGSPEITRRGSSPTRLCRGKGSGGSATLVESSGGWSRNWPSFGLVEVPHA
jgi:hypothetical protein